MTVNGGRKNMLSNSRYDEIERIYELRRTFANDKRKEREEELYEKYPALEEIDRKIADDSIKAGIAAVKGDESALEELKRSTEMTLKNRSDFLKNVCRVPENYLEDVFECKKCKDTGWIGDKHCSCFYKTVIEKFYMTPARLSLLERENFDTFDDSLFPDDMIDAETGMSAYNLMNRAYEAATSFVENFETSYTNLLITGEVGRGKTFLSNCITKALIDRGITVLYLPATELFEMFREASFGDFDKIEEARRRLDVIYEAQCLIIDDLGTEMNSQFNSSQLFACLEKRLLARKPVVITTNLSFADIEKRYTPRVESRISHNFDLLVMPGEDKRGK